MDSIDSGTRACILIVDDNPFNIIVLERILQQEYDICSACDGPAALALAREHLPDLILLDIIMPGMTGFEVMSILKEEPATTDIPVIFITALDQGNGETQGLELGAADYIHKPFNLDITALRIRNHIVRKQQRDLLIAQKREMEETIARIKRLEGIISICSYCKQIRNDQQSWQQMERYISDHSEAQFSHTVCPSCLGIHYPDFTCKEKAVSEE